ncbi:Clavaminate synthase-like protein [Karstenula rhodostoma CBS 690.94]|uniref:Clavaminate synthase-like protein n=1 Tax=Karstenula rhodostoma CBS 690.94 TaxID=1392251 RepID=A0A9P4PQ92_9PLEO|nr:Clavaminate synthase-like protein [Karstenula rhodostoma CBS 690.94]
MSETAALPILDLSLANSPHLKQQLLEQLHDALFNVGFLYIKNHGVSQEKIKALTSLLPALFDQTDEAKASLSKLNSPHFLGYSGFAEEVTLGQKDLREQFDFATELPVVYNPQASTKLYYRLRGPNQWPHEGNAPGFRKAFLEYHDELQALSYRFVHLIEEAFCIPTGTFDAFFPRLTLAQNAAPTHHVTPQHRIKLVKYPASLSDLAREEEQGVGAHKDSSGWLTFLYQVGKEEGLEVLDGSGSWIRAPPVEGTFVVNFGNAFEAATEGAVKATIHRVITQGPRSKPRYSIPFFQGLPLDLTIEEVRQYIPEHVRALRPVSERPNSLVSSFADSRWDNLGESQLRKWIRSHEDVAKKWYGDDVLSYYLQ